MNAASGQPRSRLGAHRVAVYAAVWNGFSAAILENARVLQTRPFDLLDMAEVFADAARRDLLDHRRDYGEERRVTVGRALGQIFTVIYTTRGPVTWLVTAWPANRKERARYAGR